MMLPRDASLDGVADLIVDQARAEGISLTGEGALLGLSPLAGHLGYAARSAACRT